MQSQEKRQHGAVNFGSGLFSHSRKGGHVKMGNMLIVTIGKTDQIWWRCKKSKTHPFRYSRVGGNPVFSAGYLILDTRFRGHDDFLRDHQISELMASVMRRNGFLVRRRGGKRRAKGLAL